MLTIAQLSSDKCVHVIVEPVSKKFARSFFHLAKL